jgi:hypothetical protein
LPASSRRTKEPLDLQLWWSERTGWVAVIFE